MSREKNKLGKMGTKLERSADDLIVPLLNQLGSQKAVARELNVAESTISIWLRRNGYKPQVKWIKGDEPPTTAA